MKNITFSADEKLIAKARELAVAKGRTLNEEFREWLAHFAAQSVAREQAMADFTALMTRPRDNGSNGSDTHDSMREVQEPASNGVAVAEKPAKSPFDEGWLNRKTREQDLKELEEVFRMLSRYDFGGPYTRDELNER